MNYIKLGLISAIVLYCIIWAITLIFPNVTVMSRVVNIGGEANQVTPLIKNETIPYSQWLTSGNTGMQVKTGENSFYTSDLYNAEPMANADTLYFEMIHEQRRFLTGGIGFYNLSPDSTTTQLFYVFETQWYKPWQKMAQLINDTRYGAHMDSSLARLKRAVESR